MTQQILVYGANGSQGAPVVQTLIAEGYRVRTLTRDMDKSRQWVEKGVDIVAADMGDPDSLARASEGCDAVFLLVPAVRRSAEEGVTFGVNAVKAAKAAGVTRVIWNTSGPVAEETSEHAESDANARVLRQLREERLSYLGLQPTLYMENVLGPWTRERLLTSNVLNYPLPHNFSVSWVAAQDFGRVAAAALGAASLPNEIVHLGGPEALDGDALSTIFGRVLDRDIRFETLPINEFRAQLEPLAGPFMTPVVAGLYNAIQTAPDPLQAAFALDTAPVANRFGIELTRFEDWLAQHATAFNNA